MIYTYDTIIISRLDTKKDSQLFTHESPKFRGAIILSICMFRHRLGLSFSGWKIELTSLEKNNGEVDISKITFYGNEKDSDLLVFGGSQGRGGET